MLIEPWELNALRTKLSFEPFSR